MPTGVSMDCNELGRRKFIAISLRLDSIVSKRVFGIHKRLVHSMPHRANAGDVREYHA